MKYLLLTESLKWNTRSMTMEFLCFILITQRTDVIYSFLQRRLIIPNFQFIPHSNFQSVIFFFMTYRKIKTNRIIIFSNCITDDFRNSLSEWPFSIFHIGKSADNKPSQFIKFATT